jgi:uncharacterized protein
MTHALTLTVLAGRYAVARLGPAAGVPPWAWDGEFAAVARTPDEMSIVCRESAVPEGVRAERGWRCLRVAGPFDFAAVGVLASLVEPLVAAGVSLFAVSTFDTDYVLVKDDQLASAVAALRRAGHTVRD